MKLPNRDEWWVGTCFATGGLILLAVLVILVIGIVNLMGWWVLSLFVGAAVLAAIGWVVGLVLANTGGV